MLRHPTLFIASTLDKASMNIARSLLKLNQFRVKEDELHSAWKYLGVKCIVQQEYFTQETSASVEHEKLVGVWRGRDAYLWIQERSLLWLNYPEALFGALFEGGAAPDVSNIIFLSKHSAASGQPSLTVHPIGIPYVNRFVAIS
jgi:D-tyrosyl-tRNA(Tyr) deacylase